MHPDAEDEDGVEDVIHVAVAMHPDAEDEDGVEDVVHVAVAAVDGRHFKNHQ